MVFCYSRLCWLRHSPTYIHAGTLSVPGQYGHRDHAACWSLNSNCFKQNDEMPRKTCFPLPVNGTISLSPYLKTWCFLCLPPAFTFGGLSSQINSIIVISFESVTFPQPLLEKMTSSRIAATAPLKKSPYFLPLAAPSLLQQCYP